VCLQCATLVPDWVIKDLAQRMNRGNTGIATSLHHAFSARQRIPRQNRTFPLHEFAMKPAIGYLRVSSAEQGRSGIGLDAQRAEIEAFARKEAFAIRCWFQDIYTGAGRDALLRRPGLRAALNEAATVKCPMIVARLDRLSRNVHFITGLREHGVHFIVARFGKDLEDFVLHLYASIAQQAHKMLVERVTAGLAAAKARGVELGSSARTKAENRRCSRLAGITTSSAAAARAEVYRPHIEAVLQEPGIRGRRITYQAAAELLNRRKITSPSGDWWRWSQVRHLSIRFGLRRRLSRKGRRLISAPRLQPWPLRRRLRRINRISASTPPRRKRTPFESLVLPRIARVTTAIAYLRVSTQ
jgi:DNA invertase Pin-like site-specific DNA recombinase